MSNPVAQCTHVKTNGEVCGSPAMSGTEFCYHHSAVKKALGKPVGKAPEEGFAPIGFLFPEDRASMQINFFLLLQAYNEQRIDQRTYNSMLSLLKSMARLLGKMGSLVEASDQRLAVSDEKASDQRPGAGDQKASDHGPRTRDEGRTVNLNAASAKLRPETCFSNAVPASASPDFLSMGKQAMQCVSAEGQRIAETYSQRRMAR
jgi:hypothetical protein